MNFYTIIELLNDLVFDNKKNQTLSKLLGTVKDNITATNLIDLLKMYSFSDGQCKALSIILENCKNNINTLNNLTASDICEFFNIISLDNNKIKIFGMFCKNGYIDNLDNLNNIKMILDRFSFNNDKQQILDILNSKFTLNDIYKNNKTNNITYEFTNESNKSVNITGALNDNMCHVNNLKIKYSGSMNGQEVYIDKDGYPTIKLISNDSVLIVSLNPLTISNVSISGININGDFNVNEINTTSTEFQLIGSFNNHDITIIKIK